MDTLPKREAGSDMTPEEGWVGIEEVAANWRALIEAQLTLREGRLL